MFSGKRLSFDIRGNKIKYIYASMNGDDITILKSGSILFSEKYILNGTLINSREVVKTLKRFIQKENILEKEVYLNISDPSIILRITKVPFMSAEDLNLFLQTEITYLFSINPNDTVYDFKILSKTEEGEKTLLNILLVSMPKGLKENYEEIFKKAGLRIKALDIYANTLERIYKYSDLKDVAVVDINDINLDFIIISDKNIFMHSNVEIVYSLKNLKNISMEDILAEESESQNNTSINEMVDYLRSYLNFFSSRRYGKNIDQLYVLGDIVPIKGMDSFLSKQLQIPVKIGFPKNVDVDSFNKLYSYSTNLGMILKED